MLKQIGGRVRKARKAAGYTQTQLAELIEIDPTVLGKIEAGKVGISATRLLTIAKILGVRACELLGEDSPALKAAS